MSRFLSKPEPLQDTIDLIAKKNMGRQWSLYALLMDHWAEIVGKEFAEVTLPAKLSFPVPRIPQRSGGKVIPPQQQGGTLKINVPRGLMMEFEFSIEQIRGRIISVLGSGVIDKIVPVGVDNIAVKHNVQDEEVVLTPEEKRTFDVQLEDIEDEGLRARLAALGEAILKDDKKKKQKKDW